MEINKGLNGFPLSSSGGFTKVRKFWNGIHFECVRFADIIHLPFALQPGQYIFEFFEQFNVNFETCPLVLNMIEEIIEVAHGGDDSQRAASKLDTMLSFLGTIFRSKEQHLQVTNRSKYLDLPGLVCEIS